MRNRARKRVDMLRHPIKGVVDASYPMGLLRLGSPQNQYEPEVNDILRRYLQTGPQLEELAQAVQAVFNRWFSPGDVPLARSREIASRLCELLPTVDDHQAT